MSSGSILLQQLRSRQSKSSSNNKSSSDGKNEKSDITTSSRDGTAVNPPVAAISQRKKSLPIATKKKQVIEVCLGPDCAVAGGGAALLEIEDLVRPQQCNKDSHNDDTKILVQPGGCRDHCTEGPNVRLISCNGGGGVDADFHKVNNPEACRRVVNSLFPTESTPTNNELHAAGHSMRSATAATNSNEHDDSNETSSSSDNVVVARLLLRKEDAKRWKAHRERAAKERRLQAISRSQGT